jgi:hypothetical protein
MDHSCIGRFTEAEWAKKLILVRNLTKLHEFICYDKQIIQNGNFYKS